MNTQEQINFLKKEIEELKRQFALLKDTSTIPYEVEQAFASRGFVETNKIGIPDPNGDYTTNEGFRQEIGISGDPETIVIPQFPVRFLELKDGSGFYIPLHAYFG